MQSWFSTRFRLFSRVTFQLEFFLQMVFEQFQEEQMTGMRTTPGHSGDENDRNSE